MVTLESVITCPQCGHKKQEIMPTESCQFLYQCENCQAVLRPLAGDCCVFCSYGSARCPSMQVENQNDEGM
jgi:rubredoxin